MPGKIIVIDPGHGGSDPGAVANGVKEKDLTLKISLYMAKRLKELGFTVYLTRDSDVTLDPTTRVNITKRTKADICISNHINSGGGTGAEVIYSIHNKDTLAKKILDNFKKAGMPIRKAFTKKNSAGNADYYFMHRNTYPTIKETVIVEYGFIDNKSDVQKLTDDKFREKLVEGVIKAVCEYTGVKYMGKVVEAEPTKIVAKKSGKELDGIIIEGVSYLQVNKLRDLGLTVNWNSKEKKVEVEL